MLNYLKKFFTKQAQQAICNNVMINHRICRNHIATLHCDLSLIKIHISRCFCFGATVCKTVRPMLADCSVCLCDVGVLWRSGSIDHDEAWHGGRPRPRPHCVRWGPAPFPRKGAQQRPLFSAQVYCGQTVAHLYCRALVFF